MSLGHASPVGTIVEHDFSVFEHQGLVRRVREHDWQPLKDGKFVRMKVRNHIDDRVAEVVVELVTADRIERSRYGPPVLIFTVRIVEYDGKRPAPGAELLIEAYFRFNPEPAGETMWIAA